MASDDMPLGVAMWRVLMTDKSDARWAEDLDRVLTGKSDEEKQVALTLIVRKGGRGKMREDWRGGEVD